ncbi:uncharacterized protein E0L32_003054 [Thyridium curvatum]|uniref:VPS37 C-terminal domain-containing protein n=1 Tax=Thyridium curvatum TaxID=1093900 RepID=A0A507BK07_9PEZI|nr:uncharacterized protein E0L32_003054 [Thyridium curvatum]TPX17411.1 hypothetical protein E0L32_003054 [Thyridium curvatum]
MYSSAPPVPPPKPLNDPNRVSPPTTTNSPRPPPPIPTDASSSLPEAAFAGTTTSSGTVQAQVSPPQSIPDPGPQWLPKVLEDKSKQDLAAILSSQPLLQALTHSPDTAHPSLSAAEAALHAALADNVRLAAHLRDDAEPRLAAQRAQAQAQLLAARQLERAWRAKQGEMDAALAPFAPASLYQRLVAGVQEQAMVCEALEESFLEHGGGGGGGGHVHGQEDGAGGGGGGGTAAMATEREAADWVRRYREAKKLYYLRQERKERWDEGRVGGWR